jgi:hypothetical protein
MGSRGRVDVPLAEVLFESLSPYHNMRLGIRSAYGIDNTGFTPVGRVLTASEVGCGDLPRLLPRLRRAGVSRVISADPLSAPGLALESSWPSRSFKGVVLAVYRLEGRLPLRAVAGRVEPVGSAAEAEAQASEVGFQEGGGVAVEGFSHPVEGAAGRIVSDSEAAGRIELVAEADRPTVVIVRDGYSAGWQATVDGAASPVLRADGRHRAVPIPGGRSRVVLVYSPPGLRLGSLFGLVSAFLALGLWLWPSRPRPAGPMSAPPAGA